MKLEIHGVTKTFGTQRAIASINLVIPSWETLALIGPSGGGKSTLLKLMAGLLVPDAGTIAFNDKPIIYEERALQEHRKRIGIVFQSWNLFPHLTALENICLPLHRVHGLSQQEAESRSLELLSRFELDKHAHKKPHALSGGQAQRVAIIRAVAIQPKMLMFDEPTSALDPLMTAEVLDLILELKKEGRNIIFVTHHLNFAKQIADWMLFFADGQAVESGTVDQVLNHPQTHLTNQYMAKVLAY